MIASADHIDLASFDVAAFERAACSTSLRDYVELAWSKLEPATPFKPNWHIDAICEHLQAVSEGHIRKLIIMVPPRHMKSLCASVFWPTWEWGPAGRATRRMLFSSYAASLSIRDSLKCRRLIEHPWYRRHWPDVVLTSDQNAKIRYDNEATGYRLATSVGGALTGEGGDIIVIDDAHNAADGESEAIRNATLDWWDSAMSTRLNDPKTGAYVIVMQRIHENDLVGHVLAHEHDWDILCLPARYEADHPTPCRTKLGFHDPRTREGELLWPERVGEAEVRDLETRLASKAAGQLQQRPTAAEGGLFKKSWFRYANTKGEWYGLGGRVVAAAKCTRFATVDTAMTEKTTSDWSVIAIWDMTPDGDLILVELWRARVDSPTLEVQIERFNKEYRPAFIAIEGVSDGLTLIQRLQRKRLPVRRMQYGETFRIPDKVSKATTAETYFSQGHIWFLAGAGYLSILEQELLTFPNATHDDQVDVVAMAAHCLQRYPATPTLQVTINPDAEAIFA